MIDIRFPCYLRSVIALLCAFSGINNNHQIRLASGAAQETPDALTAFRRWLEKRPDLGRYQDRHYPVYVVTAEGGGLYAAIHAASTLARIQDSCPAFARHTFAISGVSGGSLGATLFSALVKADPTHGKAPSSDKCSAQLVTNGPYEKAIEAYFQSDLLTPLLASTLFPDFFQRFVPVPIPAFDRARALELSYEQAWQKAMQATGRPEKKSIFSDSFRELWAAEHDAPALLLNATSVRHGDRIVISPFKLKGAGGFNTLAVDILNKTAATPVSTAAVISARFPLITPAGWVKDEETQFVDGGFYDNAGVLTAVDLIQKLQRSTPGAPTGSGSVKADDCAPGNAAVIATDTSGPVRVCFKMIVIKRPTETARFTLHGEFAAPVATVLTIRGAHGRAGVRTAHSLYCGGKNCGLGALAINPHIYFGYLVEQSAPLGWFFSKASLARLIENGGVHPCPIDTSQGMTTASVPGSAAADAGDESTDENACLLPRISRDLNGG